MARRGKLTEARRAAADLPLGSWRRTLTVALVVVGAFAAVVGAAIQFGDLRHASFPGHPYPPPGTYRNPFSNNPDDLVNARDAARVKADLLHAGDVELQAFTRGDPNLLSQSDTGNRLVALQQAIARNDQNGQTERWQNHLTSITVGRLEDPRDSSVTWCVEERGTSTVEFVTKSGGSIVTRQVLTIDNKFWLVRSSDRYLITDAQLTTKASAVG